MSSSSLNPFNFAFLAVGSPDQNGSKHQYHHQPSLGSQSFIQPTAQKRQTLSNSNLDLTASSKTLMDLTSSIPEPIVIPKSTIIEGDVNMYSFITSPPKLSNPIPSIYRIVRSVSPLPANGFIKLEVIDARNSEGTVMWSSMLNELRATKVDSNCILLSSSYYVSRRDITDHKPTMINPLIDEESSRHQIIPILLSFSTAGELERIQSCLVTYTPTLFCSSIKDFKAGSNWCHLDTSDVTTVQTYFQYYGKMSNQMNMLQDSVRTELYRQSIFSNPSDFIGKRVLDVGAGSGILSFFSAQAGASVVYAVEASSMSSVIATLAEANIEYGCRIRVVNRTVEALDVARDLDGFKVDVLVSEPIGTFLFNERMIESYLFARDAFLKPGGRMYPNRCRLYLAPFSDPVLFNDVTTRCTFWTNQDFYGLNLSSVVDRAIEEQLAQPVVDYIDPNAIVCSAWHHEDFDLETIERVSLANMEFHFTFPISTACLVHGLAGWFDVLFEGSERHVGFSTAPWCSPTHWYQIRFLLKQPIAANPGQTISGTLRMTGNSQQSYFLTIKAQLDGTNVSSESTVIDLKDPDYRYYSNPSATYVPNQTTNNMNTKIPTTSTRSTSNQTSSSSIVISRS